MQIHIQQTTNSNFRKRLRKARHTKPVLALPRPFDPVAYAAALEILG